MTTEQRLIEVESKIAYQEDLTQTLNDVVFQQQKQIEQLQRQNRKLLERLQTLVESQEPEQEQNNKPPHY